MTEPEDLNATKRLTRLVNQLGSAFKTRREKAYAALREAPGEKVRQLLTGRLAKDLRTTRRLICRPMYESPDAHVRNVTETVTAAWIRMLPTVTGESANTFNSRQRRMLRTALRTEAEPRLFMNESRCNTAIAIMQCMAAIGDLDARPIIERIAKWENVTENEQAVAAQARECIRALDLIKEQGRTGAVLLRSSSAPETQTGNLLRAASETTEVDAAELLRANQVAANAAVLYQAINYSHASETEEVVESKIRGG